ncbi:hypothetical protein SISSUDRAFT_1022005 [Sistotremastrum suecicum HHB10207 ss-3]|uniref:Uncharacterized protein n=1 Tax=Sistotremastrum suecicum HHB10207 ss-3 TaxID=1314776 RepID=A0A166D232_9AGAM|nr:hypothetical protein SISSUDRAFT_1022005 [Sistotremastrum suecicum HHB10207 ss-3]
MGASWTDKLFLKFVNIIVYLGCLVLDVYTILKLETVYFGKETYFTPSPWIFAIPALIHILFLGFIVYQLFPRAKSLILDSISWTFPLLILLDALFINLWFRQYYIFAFIFSVLISLNLSWVEFSINKSPSIAILRKTLGIIRQAYAEGGNLPEGALDEPEEVIEENIHDKLWIHLPIALYSGFIIILNILTLFQAFGVDAATEPAGIWTKVLVFLALFVVVRHAPDGTFPTIGINIIISLPTTLTLFAIFQHQTDSFIRWSAFTFAVISSIIILVKLLLWWFGAKYGSAKVVHDEERAPLIADN